MAYWSSYENNKYPHMSLLQYDFPLMVNSCGNKLAVLDYNKIIYKHLFVACNVQI